jgi:hypothetical protein
MLSLTLYLALLPWATLANTSPTLINDMPAPIRDYSYAKWSV